MTIYLADFDPDEGVNIYTDTLATSEGRPYMYCTKTVILHHMRMAMVVTGSGELLARWAEFLRCGVLALDVVMLDQYVPESLRRIAAEVQTDQPDLDTTSTAYHFGIDEDGFCRGFAYRSTSEFQSEPLVAGRHIKPVPTHAIDGLGEISPVDLAITIRAQQAQVDEDQRIYIGGELWLTRLSRDGIIATAQVHRFEDWADDWNEMCALHGHVD